MTSLFSPPKMPSPAIPAPPAPDISGAQSTEAMEALRRRLAQSQGRSSLVLNPVAEGPAPSKQKMLLGA